MKVKRLTMKSFRGINDLTLDFDPSQVVLIGVNGSGKSSILDCLAILLSWFTSLIVSSKGTGRRFGERDISNGSNETHNEITVSVDCEEVTWSLTRAKKGHSKDTSSDLTELRQLTNEIRNQLNENPKINLTVFVYYAVNRAVLDIPLRIKKAHSFEPLSVYEKALDSGGIDFRIFFEWFRNQEDLENELQNEWWENNWSEVVSWIVRNESRIGQFYSKFRKANNSKELITYFQEFVNNKNNQPLEIEFDFKGYNNKELEAVRQAIYSLIPDFSNLRVRRSPLRMTVLKQGQELIINQLSDGEKCLLAMVGDLARRLAIANPNLEDPLQGSGVVLIDEIELHLHPGWQRKIIPALTRTFPNCQFIVTTHSPQVVSEVKSESIYILEYHPDGIVARKPESSFGRDSNRILEDLMDTPARPQQIKESLLELFQLIDKGDLESAKKLRQEIVEKIGEDEPELVKANVSIRRREILKH